MNDSRLKSIQDTLNRRVFLRCAGGGLGLLALGSLLGEQARADEKAKAEVLAGLPHFTPKAKRVIYLFQSGAPSQMDLFDPKPAMDARRGEDLPASIRMGQRLTTMTSGQSRFPVAPSLFKFAQHGEAGAWVSELMPHISGLADQWCILRSMNTA